MALAGVVVEGAAHEILAQQAHGQFAQIVDAQACRLALIRFIVRTLVGLKETRGAQAIAESGLIAQ